MLTKRIIPCLDIHHGKVMKGINFENLKQVGDPVDLAKKYDEQGADEIVFLDITASFEERDIMLDIIKRAAYELSIPLTVGGGIKSLDDIKQTLDSGADKVSLNSFAINNPQLVKKASEKFGSQCIVGAIDAKYHEQDKKYYVYIKGGRKNTGIELLEWAQKLEYLGAGEILLTSMDKDGVKTGYDIDMLNTIIDKINIPVIASGGCGNADHIVEVFKKTNSDAALAASIFHYDEYTIDKVKNLLMQNKIPVRPPLKNIYPNFEKQPLIPVIVQDYYTNEVRMLAYMDKSAYDESIKTKTAVYYSRSRQKRWLKGETSGEYQHIKSMFLDCDNDTLLIKVIQEKDISCHTGERTCFYNRIIF